MTSAQYKRANSTVFPAIMVIFGYMVLSLGAFLATGGGTIATYMQIAVSLIAVIISIVVFVVKKDTKICTITMLLVSSLAYLVIMIFNGSNTSFAYAFPILLAAITFLNKKIAYIGNIIILLGNILRLVIRYSSSSAEQQRDLCICIFISAIVFFASIRIISLLIKNNEENLAIITEAAEIQKQNADKMLGTAKDIAALFDEAMEMVDRLNESIASNNFAMSNIASSTESTAESITKQAAMCGDIQKQVDNAGREMDLMIEATTGTDKNVSDGVTMVKELKDQAANVEKAGNDTVEVIDSLTGKVSEVESFVGTILSISNQTNLLALNASIEAARAGEAGKGFAVVAEEIRQLSEQTKTASNHITNIIKELNADTERANETIRFSVESVNKQNEVIESTTENFEKIKTDVENLTDSVKKTDDAMKTIIDATTIISDNISTLSATSEEVAASSAEGLKFSSATVADMKLCKEILEKIYALSQNLQ